MTLPDFPFEKGDRDPGFDRLPDGCDRSRRSFAAPTASSHSEKAATDDLLDFVCKPLGNLPHDFKIARFRNDPR